MAVNEPRTTSNPWSYGIVTDVVADTQPSFYDYKWLQNLFPPLPGNTSTHSYGTATDTNINTTGYTHIFSAPSKPSFIWSEQDYISGPQFQSLLRRPGETDDEYQVRKDISELACVQGGHRWLKDPASTLQTCELCGGIGL